MTFIIFFILISTVIYRTNKKLTFQGDQNYKTNYLENNNFE